LKELKKNTKQVTQLKDRFETRAEYVNSLRDGFMSLENRIIIMEHSLSCMIQERECTCRSVPAPDNGSEYIEKKKEKQHE